MVLTRGSVSPRRTRRSSASDDGRVLVGSRPMARYSARVRCTASSSAVPPARSRASASANGASRRWSCSTTVTPSKARQAGVTIEASAGATSRVTPTRPPTVGAGPWPSAPRDRLLHLAGEGARFFRPAAGRRDRIEDGDADVARRRHELALAHHEAAAVDRDRHHRQARLDRHHEGAGAEARERAVEAARALREHEQRVARLSSARAPGGTGRRRGSCDRPGRGRCAPGASRGTESGPARPWPGSAARSRASRTAPGCRRCSGGWRRTRSWCRAAADRARSARGVTPVVFRISHDQARAHLWAKRPDRSKNDDASEIVPSTIV